MEPKIDIAIIGECLIELSANGSLADTSTLNKYYFSSHFHWDGSLYRVKYIKLLFILFH